MFSSPARIPAPAGDAQPPSPSPKEGQEPQPCPLLRFRTPYSSAIAKGARTPGPALRRGGATSVPGRRSAPALSGPSTRPLPRRPAACACAERKRSGPPLVGVTSLGLSGWPRPFPEGAAPGLEHVTVTRRGKDGGAQGCGVRAVCGRLCTPCWSQDRGAVRHVATDREEPPEWGECRGLGPGAWN